MALLRKYWSSLSSEPMTEEAIRAQHRPEKHFKFYVNRIEAGKSFTTKAGHDFVLYVMAGSCKTSLEGLEITLCASELITLEKSTYHFDVQGEEELKIMKVFRLV